MKFSFGREEYPVLDQITYLDTPFEGLVARSIWEGVAMQVEKLQADFITRDAKWRYALRAEVREMVAGSIHVPVERVALIPGFSFGLRALLPWLAPFKNVLMIENDYPTMLDGFSNGLFNMTFIPRNEDGSCSYEDLAFAMEKNQGGVFAFSHVYFETGFRFDLEWIAALAKANEVTTVMDITQSFGSMPIDVSEMNIDVVLCSTYKWCGAGFGNGFLSVRAECEKLLPAIDQFNTGHLDPFAMFRLKLALERLSELDAARIWRHIEDLNALLCKGLDERGIEVYSNRNEPNRSAILQFTGTEKLKHELADKKIRTSFRGRGIRVGLHWYNEARDVERLMEAL